MQRKQLYKCILVAITCAITTVILWRVFHKDRSSAGAAATSAYQASGEVFADSQKDDTIRRPESSKRVRHSDGPSSPVASKDTGAKLFTAKAFSISSCMLNGNACDALGISVTELAYVNKCIQESLIKVCESEKTKISVDVLDEKSVRITYKSDLGSNGIIQQLKDQLRESLSEAVVFEIIQPLRRTSSFHDFKEGYQAVIRQSDSQVDFLFGNLRDPRRFGDRAIMASAVVLDGKADNFAASFFIRADEIEAYPRWTYLTEIVSEAMQR